jgi:hypothetical protein
LDIKLLIEKKDEKTQEVTHEEKTFVVPFIKGRMFRRVLEINNTHDLDNMSPETLDTLVDFVVECFGGKFSSDQFYDGVPADQMIEIILGFIKKISSSAGSGIKDPNVQTVL